MIKKIAILSLFLYISMHHLFAQEVQARVTVLSSRVGTQVDRKIFNSLQQQLTNLINTRKWTSDAYRLQERIECSFIINIEQVLEPNLYKATLTIQAARPVFNSSYKAAIVNHLDADLTFKYIEFQPVEFNDNRVQGNDAAAANLTAIMAYYVYTIIGIDNDTFSPKGGETQFNKALNVVTNAPEGKGISGWKIFDGLKSRYWLNENLTNNRYNIIHDAIYTYYRSGMDKMYENEKEARANILQALIQLKAFNKENPNTMILQFFMQAKWQELIGIFKTATPTEKAKAIEILSEIDIVNGSKYREGLQ